MPLLQDVDPFSWTNVTMPILVPSLPFNQSVSTVLSSTVIMAFLVLLTVTPSHVGAAKTLSIAFQCCWTYLMVMNTNFPNAPDHFLCCIDHQGDQRACFSYCAVTAGTDHWLLWHDTPDGHTKIVWIVVMICTGFIDNTLGSLTIFFFSTLWNALRNSLLFHHVTQVKLCLLDHHQLTCSNWIFLRNPTSSHGYSDGLINNCTARLTLCCSHA
jgi:hypothetical protein